MKTLLEFLQTKHAEKEYPVYSVTEFNDKCFVILDSYDDYILLGKDHPELLQEPKIGEGYKRAIEALKQGKLVVFEPDYDFRLSFISVEAKAYHLTFVKNVQMPDINNKYWKEQGWIK